MNIRLKTRLLTLALAGVWTLAACGAPPDDEPEDAPITNDAPAAIIPTTGNVTVKFEIRRNGVKLGEFLDILQVPGGILFSKQKIGKSTLCASGGSIPLAIFTGKGAEPGDELEFTMTVDPPGAITESGDNVKVVTLTMPEN